MLLVNFVKPCAGIFLGRRERERESSCMCEFSFSCFFFKMCIAKPLSLAFRVCFYILSTFVSICASSEDDPPSWFLSNFLNPHVWNRHSFFTSLLQDSTKICFMSKYFLSPNILIFFVDEALLKIAKAHVSNLFPIIYELLYFLSMNPFLPFLQKISFNMWAYIFIRTPTLPCVDISENLCAHKRILTRNNSFYVTMVQ